MSYITRKEIPDDFYLAYPYNYNKTKKDWIDVQMFKFDNGLIFYIGTFMIIKPCSNRRFILP